MNNRFDKNDISIGEILFLLLKGWRVLLISVTIGISISVAYILNTPRQYEGIANIQLAQVAKLSGVSSVTTGIIEEANSLMSRMSMPSMYSEFEINACGLGGILDADQILSKSISIVPVKGSPNFVQVKFYSTSKDQILPCLNAIYKLIQTTQSLMVRPINELAEKKIDFDRSTLIKIKSEMKESSKSGSISVLYLINQDELRLILNEINVLNYLLEFNSAFGTKLDSAPYVAKSPYGIKKREVFMYGLCGGILIGVICILFLSLFKNLCTRWRDFISLDSHNNGLGDRK